MESSMALIVEESIDRPSSSGALSFCSDTFFPINTVHWILAAAAAVDARSVISPNSKEYKVLLALVLLLLVMVDIVLVVVLVLLFEGKE